ncbi:MAG: nucleotide exchange factor GrpE [Kiritimatiellia bacterium]
MAEQKDMKEAMDGNEVESESVAAEDPAKKVEEAPGAEAGKAAGEEAASEEKAADDKAAGDRATNDKAAGDKAADDKATDDKAAGDKAAGESAAEEKPAEQPDWKDRFARLMADFDNFRKRTERDREDLAKFAAKDVLKSMLTTVDNLALALDKAKDKADDPFVAGVRLVYDGLLKTLAEHGAAPLDSVGEPFNADYQEALATLPSPDTEEGIVMNEVKRGWLLHGKLLRAAQVVVSAGKPA